MQAKVILSTSLVQLALHRLFCSSKVDTLSGCCGQQHSSVEVMACIEAYDRYCCKECSIHKVGSRVSKASASMFNLIS